MDIKRILVMTDSPKLHTGFGGVGKRIFTYLTRTGKYNIKSIGWFHQETQEDVIYPIVQTARDERGGLSSEDKYAHKTFPKVVDDFKPDLVWTLGDMWMVDHVAGSPNRSTFKWMGYFPIDGHPVPSKWGITIRDMDYPVAYGNYGKEVIEQRAPDKDIDVAYHGVDTKNFHPLSYAERMEARKELTGISSDKIVIGIVARNQPRKAFDKLFEAYFYILHGMYCVCPICGKATVCPYDIISKKVYPVNKCKHCGFVGVKKSEGRDDVRLYVHGAIADCGWDLMDLQNDFNLGGKILVNPGLKIGVGVPEYSLNGIYNSFDIFTLPTRGEGFGLPILEAMSCGVPVVVTNYSAHPEWCRGCGELVPPTVLEAEPITNIRRAIIDMDCYVSSLLKLINDKSLREKYGKAGREKAITMDWDIICKQWEKLIDDVLYPDGKMPEKVDPKEVEYELEEM